MYIHTYRYTLELPCVGFDVSIVYCPCTAYICPCERSRSTVGWNAACFFYQTNPVWGCQTDKVWNKQSVYSNSTERKVNLPGVHFTLLVSLVDRFNPSSKRHLMSLNWYQALRYFILFSSYNCHQSRISTLFVVCLWSSIPTILRDGVKSSPWIFPGHTGLANEPAIHWVVYGNTTQKSHRSLIVSWLYLLQFIYIYNIHIYNIHI